VCHLIDVIDDVNTSTMYMVVDFLGGGSMEQLRMSHPGGRVPPSLLRTHFRQMVSGLNYLHQVVQIAHRDIKPDNVMLGSNGEVRIIDFGTAEIFIRDKDGTASDVTHKMAGTPAFYAPEMCDADIDEYEMLPTDLWALGVSLYQLFYGELPFKSTGLMQLMDEIDQSKVTYPPMDKTEDAEDLLKLVQGLLTKAPADRLACREVMQHPWVTARGKLTFSKRELTCKEITVSADDIERATSPLSLSTVIHVKMQMHGRAASAREVVRRRSLPDVDVSDVSGVNLDFDDELPAP